jgi:hypothetical protein
MRYPTVFFFVATLFTATSLAAPMPVPAALATRQDGGGRGDSGWDKRDPSVKVRQAGGGRGDSGWDKRDPSLKVRQGGGGRGDSGWD